MHVHFTRLLIHKHKETVMAKKDTNIGDLPDGIGHLIKAGIRNGIEAKQDEEAPAIQAQYEKEYIKDLDEDQVVDTSQATKIIPMNLTPEGFGWTKVFLPLEHCLVWYAVTQILNKYGLFIRDLSSLESKAEHVSIETGMNETSQVYRDFVAPIKYKNKTLVITGFLNKEFYTLGCSGPDRASVEAFEGLFKHTLENSNFYIGKSLMLGEDLIQFIKTPDIRLDDVILSDKIKKEYEINVLKFLTDKRMQAVTLRRGLLLYGPPGTGKTSSLKALFHELHDRKITAVHLTGEMLAKNKLTQIFDFISTYLAPCMIVMEDMDLIAPDRDSEGVSAYIGTLLNVLNGVEDQTKPIVIMATTNRANVLDGAVTRPCRFDRKIHIDFPSSEELTKIFRNASGIEPPPGSMDQPSDDKKKLTGAHVDEIVNTARLLAIDRGVAIEECIKEAVKTVTEDFVIIHPSDRKRGMGDVFGAPASYASSSNSSSSSSLDKKPGQRVEFVWGQPVLVKNKQ